MFYASGTGYKSQKEAIEGAVENLETYLKALGDSKINYILTANDYTITQKGNFYRVGNIEKKTTIDITKEELIQFILDNISPESIRIFGNVV